ncbi:HNH endonuclease [Plantactinospora sp. DSM 117369]
METLQVIISAPAGSGKTETYLGMTAALVDSERTRRREWWEQVRDEAGSSGLVTPAFLRGLTVYGGGQGVWVDAKRTTGLRAGGVAVGVMHTGRHYPDDLSESGIFYHYPETDRPPGRDKAEIRALKGCAELDLPLFVITRPTPSSKMRRVEFGWVAGWDDASKRFLIKFMEQSPAEIINEDRSDASTFELYGNRSRRRVGTVRTRPGQQEFKLKVFLRYGARCPLSGIAVAEMIDAAHLVPDAVGGTDDPRNGLPLNAALHRAFDAGLFAINPETYAVETRPDGPAAAALGIISSSIAGLPRKPHPDALRWRYEEWLKSLS